MLVTAIDLFTKAEKERTASRFLKAIPLYIKTRSTVGADLALKGACSFALGDAYRMTGEFEKSAAHYAKAREISLKLNDETGAIDSLVGLALSMRASGDVAEAIVILNDCLKSYEKTGDIAGAGFTIWARAGALRIKGDLKSAIAGFKAAQKIFRKLKDAGGVGYCHTGLGGATRVAGDYRASGDNYRKANAIFVKMKDTFGVAYSYCGIANSMRMRDDYKGSLKYFKLAKDNYKKIGDRVSYAYTLWGRASALLMLGRTKEALKDVTEAMHLFKATKDNRGIVYCMLTIAQVGILEEDKIGVKIAKDAMQAAKKLGLKVEAGYAKQILGLAKKGAIGLPLNLA